MDPVAELLVFMQQERDPMTQLVLLGTERTQVQEAATPEHHRQEERNGETRGDGERDPLA